VAVLLIASIGAVNVAGIKPVAGLATALNVAVIVPFAIMFFRSARMWHHNPFVPLIPPGKPLFQVFGVGLALGLWLYSGYEQLSTVAEEVQNPQKNYPRALAWVVPLSMATYFIPTASSLAALDNWRMWRTGFFPEVASLIGGNWLGIAMTVSAATMQVAILNSTVLACTRIPFALAEDGYLPPFLGRLHPRFGTPWLAIAFSCAIYCLLAWKSLTQLISVYIWLRIATSLMTVLAAWQMRRKQPDLPRPFRIPKGRAGMIYAVGAPIVMSAFAMIASDRFALYWGPVALLLGPAAYCFFRKYKVRADDPA
jgi:amino acid transporter